MCLPVPRGWVAPLGLLRLVLGGDRRQVSPCASRRVKAASKVNAVRVLQGE